MNIRPQDRDTLRALAARYMEHALSDQNNEKRRLWYALNEMRMQKPMITIDQIPWHELAVDDFLTLTVQDPYFLQIEATLRREIYKWEHMPADMVLNPYIIIPRPVVNTGYGIVHHCSPHESEHSVHSVLYEDQFDDMEDVMKIQVPQVSLDHAAEVEIWDTAKWIFDGVAPIRWGGVMIHTGLWDFVSQWKGVENCYIDFLDRPELIHAIMERVTNCCIAQIEQVNKLRVYDVVGNYCHCSYTFNKNLPSASCDPDHATTHDGWTWTMAQLFTSVSPEINKEFEVPYISRILEHFGSVYYGCCERLDDRLDVISKMPNIRKVSCSPWSDREHFAACLPKEYIMSNKPNPSYLAGSTFDEEVVRKDLRRTIAAAKANGLGLEFLMKDISTIRNDPQRLWRWSEIALEETMNAAL